MSAVEVVERRPVTVMGDEGSLVLLIQRRLNAHGADPQLKVDGRFGVLTDAAVRSFQGSHGLEVDGRVGQATWPALLVSPVPRRTVPQRSPGAQTMLLAGRLEIEALLNDWYGSGMTRAQCGVLLHDYLQHSEPWTQMDRRAQLALALEILR